MSIIRLALELFALYLLYKLVFDLIIPVIRTTRQVKKQFGDMSAQMQEKMRQQQNSGQRAAPVQPENTNGKYDDYIEFEEIKKK